MAKDLMFKLRLDTQDRARLDALAEHYSAPAATVLRILIKKEFDGLVDPKADRAEPETHRRTAFPIERLRPARAPQAVTAIAEKVDVGRPKTSSLKKKRASSNKGRND